MTCCRKINDIYARHDCCDLSYLKILLKDVLISDGVVHEFAPWSLQRLIAIFWAIIAFIWML